MKPKIVHVDFNDSMLGTISREGEHNRTQLVFALDEDLQACDFINAEFGIEDSGEKLVLENLLPQEGENTLSVSLTQDVTVSGVLTIQLVGYVVDSETTEPRIIAKSPVVSGVVTPSINGIEKIAQGVAGLLDRILVKLNDLVKKAHTHNNKDILDKITEDTGSILEDLIVGGRNLIKDGALDKQGRWVNGGLTVDFDQGYMVLNKEATSGRISYYQTKKQNDMLAASENVQTYTATIEVMKLPGVAVPSNSSVEIHFGDSSRRLTMPVPLGLSDSSWTRLTATTPKDFDVFGDMTARIMVGQGEGGFACRNFRLESFTPALESVNEAKHTHNNKKTLDLFYCESLETGFETDVSSTELKWRGKPIAFDFAGSKVSMVQEVEKNGKRYYRLWFTHSSFSITNVPDYIDLPIDTLNNVTEESGNITLNGAELVFGLGTVGAGGIKSVSTLPTVANEGDVVYYCPPANTLTGADSNHRVYINFDEIERLKAWILKNSDRLTGDMNIDCRALLLNAEGATVSWGCTPYEILYGYSPNPEANLISHWILTNDEWKFANDLEGGYSTSDSPYPYFDIGKVDDEYLLANSIFPPEYLADFKILYVEPRFYRYSNGEWVEILTPEVDVDLSDYYTKQEIDNKGFITKADIPTDESYELIGETPLTLAEKSNIKLESAVETSYEAKTPTIWNFDEFFASGDYTLKKCTLEKLDDHYKITSDTTITDWYMSYIQLFVPVEAGRTYTLCWDNSASKKEYWDTATDWGGMVVIYDGTDTSKILANKVRIDEQINLTVTPTTDLIQIRYHAPSHNTNAIKADVIARFNAMWLDEGLETKLTEPYNISGTFNGSITLQRVPKDATVTATPTAKIYVKAPTDKTLSKSDVPADAKETGERIESVKNLLPLYGKTIVNFGDSIFGNAQPPVDISTHLANKTGATVYNCGFGGCRMTPHSVAEYAAFSMCNLATAISSGDFTQQENAVASTTVTLNNSIKANFEKLKNIDFSKVDIVTISYGTNDYYNNGVNLDNEENPLDVSTYGGALRYSIETLLNKYPNLRIFILSIAYRFFTDENNEFVDDSNTHANNYGKFIRDYNTKLQEVAAEYNLLYVDDYNIGIGKYNRYQYFPIKDGTHHNETGRKLIAEHLAKELF